MNRLDTLSTLEKNAVAQFRTAVASVCGSAPCELRIFGSRARGEGDVDSDLDILVLLPTEDQQLKIRIWDVADAVFVATDILISPLVLSQQQYASLKTRERLIAQDIEREGIPV